MGPRGSTLLINRDLSHAQEAHITSAHLGGHFGPLANDGRGSAPHFTQVRECRPVRMRATTSTQLVPLQNADVS